MLGDSKCHCTTLIISHHSSWQFSGETISSALYLQLSFACSPKPRPTAQLSMQRLGSRSTAYTTLCGSPAGYATPSLPLIAGEAAELSWDRGRNRMNEHQWDSIIPYYFIIFYLTTFLLTFSTILLLNGKGTIQIFYVFVTCLSRFITRKVVQLQLLLFGVIMAK